LQRGEEFSAGAFQKRISAKRRIFFSPNNCPDCLRKVPCRLLLAKKGKQKNRQKTGSTFFPNCLKPEAVVCFSATRRKWTVFCRSRFAAADCVVCAAIPPLFAAKAEARQPAEKGSLRTCAVVRGQRRFPIKIGRVIAARFTCAFSRRGSLPTAHSVLKRGGQMAAPSRTPTLRRNCGCFFLLSCCAGQRKFRLSASFASPVRQRRMGAGS